MTRRWSVWLLLPLLVTVAAGCGRDDGGTHIASAGGTPAASGSPGTSGLSQQDKALKFAACMREHGVPMDDPDPSGDNNIRIGGPGLDPTTMQAAQQACRQYSPFGEGGPRQDPKAAENMRRFAQCMRDNGVPNFPDPDGALMRIDESVGGDPDFPAAQKKCEKEFLSARPTGTPR